MEDVPLVNWPSESGSYKVVQFEEVQSKKPYMRFGIKANPVPRDYHEHILERFADEIKVECIVIDGNDEPVSALPEDCPYATKGAGWCQLDLEARTARFTGKSTDYQMSIDYEHLERLKRELPDWNIE